MYKCISLFRSYWCIQYFLILGFLWEAPLQVTDAAAILIIPTDDTVRYYASPVENILQSGPGIMSFTLFSTSFSFIYILLRISGMPSPNSSWWNKRRLCLSCKNWKILAVSSKALVKERNIFPLIFCSISVFPMLYFFFFPSCCGLTTSSSGVLWQHGINPHPSLSLSFLHTHTRTYICAWEQTQHLHIYKTSKDSTTNTDVKSSSGAHTLTCASCARNPHHYHTLIA